MKPPEQAVLGLRANWAQFSLLVVINAFVGAMIGLERTLLPSIAEHDFGLIAHAAVLSFIAVFGTCKALSNFGAGALADRVGRKRVLLIGWVIALPVPIVLMLAPSWGWVLFANVLLGVSQGLTWSTTVIMKIDLVGPSRRGLAMGLNEFAGYVALAVSAFCTAEIAARYGLRPAPFYLGVGYGVLGLGLSLFVRDTAQHVAISDATRTQPIWDVVQAGFVNNLNDGMAWGLFPMIFGASLTQTGFLVALYPATWGIAQLFTGALSDRFGRTPLIVAGMWLQALAIAAVVRFNSFSGYAVSSVALGVGTAMVYPTLLAAIGDRVTPGQRARAVGTYRLWRDLGYAAGALLSGVVADVLGVSSAILVVAGLTFASGALTSVARLRHDRRRGST